MDDDGPMASRCAFIRRGTDGAATRVVAGQKQGVAAIAFACSFLLDLRSAELRQ